MYVNINSSFFSKEEHYRKLDKILHFFEEGKHDWVIESDEEIDNILDSQWIKSHGGRIQAVIAEFSKRAFNDLLYTPKRKRKSRLIIYIKVSEVDSAISIDFATKYLNEPLYLIVENEFSDSSFLTALIHSFKKTGKKIKKALDNEWVVFYNAGGKEMIKKIITDRASRDPLPNRMFVLCDSDKKNKLDAPKSTSNLISTCKSLAIKYHVLEKREIENYLPKEAFNQLSGEIKEVTDAYYSLSSEQKDYYNLCEGYSNRKGTIYSDLSDELHNKLKLGFRVGNFNPKKELYLLFNNPCVNRENLLDCCRDQENPNELTDILKKINELL